MNRVLILEDLLDAQRWLSEAVRRSFPQAQIHCFETLQAALQALDDFVPNLCLVDLRLPDGSGVEFIRQCRVRAPSAHQIVTTMYDDDMHLFPAIQAGADGYLLKEEPQAVIARALTAVADGTPALSPQISRRILDFMRHTDAGTVTPGTAADCLLSPREQECLVVIARGYKTAEAADMLGVSYHTAARHVKNIYAKLGISSRAEAVQQAIRLGLLE